jgi:ribosomal protein S18 acetylase RimI-like enzyme
MCDIRPTCGEVDAETRLLHILPWVRAAGDPYYAWLFQDASACNGFVDSWLQNPQSEVFIGRMDALWINSHIAGGFIALGGEELHKCRRADTRNLLVKSGSELRRKMVGRLTLSEGLFPPVCSDEYYLSKLGINRDFQGKGYGTLLVDAYLGSGHQRGFHRYRLDVAAGNEIALKCYEKAGFKIASESTTKDGELTYLSMTREM